MSDRKMIRHIGSLPWHRRYRYTAPTAWRAMTDDEWEQIRPLIVQTGAPGRPMQDPRRRLDACFYAACMPEAWHHLPEEFGNFETVSRTFRRWAERGVWDNLLLWAASGRMGLDGLEYIICRAFRRAWRVVGLAGLKLARRVGLLTALRAPPHWLPDPDLSAFLRKHMLAPAIAAAMQGQPPSAADSGMWVALLRACEGRARIPAGSAPP
jgi:hypothetical protein